jgi:hypothetical protein
MHCRFAIFNEVPMADFKLTNCSRMVRRMGKKRGSTSSNLTCELSSDDDSVFNSLGSIPRDSEAEIQHYYADIELEATPPKQVFPPIVSFPVNVEAGSADAKKSRCSARIAAHQPVHVATTQEQFSSKSKQNKHVKIINVDSC